MRAVIQRVKSSSVIINGNCISSIEYGLLLLLGIEETDNDEDVFYLVNKIAAMRIFADNEGKMNLSINDVNGEALVVSQFTLYASTKKGNRPSFIKAAKPNQAIPLYNKFNSELGRLILKPLKTGEFGADMQVELINDGPVTILLDSKNKE